MAYIETKYILYKQTQRERETVIRMDRQKKRGRTISGDMEKD